MSQKAMDTVCPFLLAFLTADNNINTQSDVDPAWPKPILYVTMVSILSQIMFIFSCMIFKIPLKLTQDTVKGCFFDTSNEGDF